MQTEIEIMGLDTTHGAWHGSYSSFDNWRTEIAKCIGIPLDLMQGFYHQDESLHGPLSLVKYQLSGQAKEQFENHQKHFPLLWDSFKPSPLHELLYHSDCDGLIEWERCEAIAEELTSILTKLQSVDMMDKTVRFINGLKLAYNKKENLEFR